MGTEVETQQGGVPALVDPATQITSEDVSLPQLKIGQYSSELVQDDVVAAGDIFTAIGKDDSDAQTQWKHGATGAKAKGVLFHVLGLRKGRSAQVDGELQTYAFNDPTAPEDSWVTYTYFVVLPEIDKDLPHKLLLTRSSAPTAKRINLILKRNEGAGPPYKVAFRLTAAKRENDKGKFFVAQIAQENSKPANVKVAEALANLVSGQAAEQRSTGTEPSI